MPARAHVEHDILLDGVRLSIATKTDAGRLVRTFEAFGENTFVQSGVAVSDDLPRDRRPYLLLNEDEARAVYQALGEYFGTQVSDNRLLRADYEHERRRVDKILDAVIKDYQEH